jgi:hypothetical protein
VQPRYKQGRGGDHYDVARGLRSHRLADMYIQHSGTSEKKKERSRRRIRAAAGTILLIAGN